jgi:hypothetical protein
VHIKESDIAGNEFVEIEEMTNRGRRNAQDEIDIDEECGRTDESIELEEEHEPGTEEPIYYHGDTSNDDGSGDGVIRLVSIAQDEKDHISGEEPSINPVN